MFHTWSWVAWLVAAAVPAFLVRNPLYLALVIGCAWLAYWTLGRTSAVGSSWGSFMRIGLFLLAVAVPFNALSIHMGQIVLFRIPASWPIVGGNITLEAVLSGVVSGVGLLTILIVFAAFNAVVDHYQLLRSTPAFLFQMGVVLSIAITFVPQMVIGAQEIRQAQRIRGHRFRGIRDLLPLVMPLLANGMERAIQLAETMEARGFGSAIEAPSQRQAVLMQGGTLAALLSVLGGLVMVAYSLAAPWLGWALVLGGVGLMLVLFALQGRRVHRTRFRRPEWQGRDTLLVLASVVVVAAVLVARALVPETVYYSPFPPSPLWPPFNPLLGGALLLLALPALLAPSTGQADVSHPPHDAHQVRVE